MRKFTFIFLLGILLRFSTNASAQGIISTYAGGGPNNLPATSANMQPNAVATDASGNLYIADPQLSRVFKVDTSGQLTVFAGTGLYGFSGDGGPATSARLNGPSGVAVAGSDVYIADHSNHRIRKVSGGNISTVAGNGIPGFGGDGGPAASAQLAYPRGVAVSGSDLYVADNNNHRIRKVSGGNISTVAGNGIAGFSGDGGPATIAQFERSQWRGSRRQRRLHH